jgi:hypothetical protein
MMVVISGSSFLREVAVFGWWLSSDGYYLWVAALFGKLLSMDDGRLRIVVVFGS